MRNASRLLVALFAIVALLALPLPAQASSTRFELLAAGAQTATAQGGGISVSGIREMLVFFSCTASSGTSETLDVYLQGSSDGGTTWFDLAYEWAVSTDGDATETAPTEVDRDFVNLSTDVACSGVKSAVKYQVFGDQVRAAWFISGTTPSYTFGVKAVGKN